MILDNVLQAIGNTPLVRLNRVVDKDSAQILVKVEGLNVGGSIKTRTAFAMIQDAKRRGLINDDTVIVEATSGNQGIGISLVGAVMGNRVVVVMPDSVSEERRKLVQLYGAEVVLVHDEGKVDDCYKKCFALAEKMSKQPNYFWPQQFENPENCKVHNQQTAMEIVNQAGCTIDGFCAGIGTGGTLTGVGTALRQINPDIVIWGIEPATASPLTGGQIGSHVQMGIGDGMVPPILDCSVFDKVVTVTDQEAIEMARQLGKLEGLACGITSGTNVVVAKRLAKLLGPGKTVVTVLPDTAERYFSTPLFQF
ncbi:MAG: cysteine synthase family protein [Clostridia bacterium]|nr:cysteine synthase family protein [Clostridia bacterium]